MTVLNKLTLRFAASLAICLAGCASNQTASKDGKPCAECLVCEHNADLACVNVEVTADTPRTEYNGKTYYFCSDDCKAAFEKSPQKYATRK